MIKLAPSILSADFSKLGEDIKVLENSGIEILHIDVMDGQFVPSISFGMPVIKSIRTKTNMFFDVHLMINEPDRYIKDFIDSGADGITVHVEACIHFHRTIQKIKELGAKASVALNPATPISAIKYVLSDLDMVLFMTVNPGFGGQKYIDNVTEKIVEFKTICDKKSLDIDIQVDGGIKHNNVKTVIDAGANIIVAGSSVFTENPQMEINKFNQIFIGA